MKRRMTMLALSAAVAAGVGGVGLAGYQDAFAGPSESPETLIASSPQTSVLFRPCDNCVISSVPAGAHIGGTEIDTGSLSSNTGAVVGHYSLQSVGVTPFSSSGPGELSLHALLVIGSDQIVADGIEEPPDNGGTAAIVGGTGRFSGARGTVTYTDQSDGTTRLRISVMGAGR
jgi:hypothetical protein